MNENQTQEQDVNRPGAKARAHQPRPKNTNPRRPTPPPTNTQKRKASSHSGASAHKGGEAEPRAPKDNKGPRVRSTLPIRIDIPPSLHQEMTACAASYNRQVRETLPLDLAITQILETHFDAYLKARAALIKQFHAGDPPIQP